MGPAARALPVFLVEAWYSEQRLPEPLDPPQMGPTWAELHPSALAFGGDHAELRRTDEWLALAQTLAAHDAHTLHALGFPRARDRDARAAGRRRRSSSTRPTATFAHSLEQILQRPARSAGSRRRLVPA